MVCRYSGFYERPVAVKRKRSLCRRLDQGSFFYPSIVGDVPKWVLSN